MTTNQHGNMGPNVSGQAIRQAEANYAPNSPSSAPPPPFKEQRLRPRGEPISQPSAPTSSMSGKKSLFAALKPSSEGEGNQSARLAILITIAYLVAFLMIVINSVISANKAKDHIASELTKTEITKSADTISERIGSQIRWMDTALAMRGSSTQIVNIAARGPNVTGVAMLDAAGNIIVSYPASAKSLDEVSLKDVPENGITLTSIMSQGGVANPVIVRKTSGSYLVTMMAPGTLVSAAQTGEIAIVSRGGRVIDGTGAIAANGVTGAFSLSQNQLSKLTTPENGSVTSSRNTSGYDAILAASNIPNTDLTIIRQAVKPKVSVPPNVAIYTILFLCTALLLAGLLRNAMNQIQTIKKTHEDSTVAEERYRVAVEGGRGGVWEIDLKNNAVYLNKSLSKLLGLSDQDKTITVSQFLGLIHAGDRERLLGMARRAHLQGILDIEVRVAHLPLVLQCRGQSSARDSVDGSTVIVGVAMDVTEQRGAQTRLQATEARLHDSLNSMTDSFVIWDAMQRLVLWNGKFADFFGFETGQLQQGLDQVVVEQYAHQSIEEVFTIEGDENVEIKLKDGRWLRYAEAQTADGGQVSIGTDITEIRAREEDLRENDIALRNTVDVLKKSQTRIMELAENYEQEKIRAEDANQSKSDFLANMSHELRTPLNAINGFSDIMKKEMFGPLGDPRYKEYVNDILFSGQHLLSLINDILDMSKIEAGKMTLNTGILQINEMISQVVRIVRGRAEEGRLKLIYENVDMEEIEADQRAVKQVLLNLITNAIKFTPEGGTVKIQAERKQAGIIVRVTDSGIGISQENIERLAKPFEQIDTENSKQQEGTGLGLALSKSLIELHGGNFLMQSELGVGTTVTFTLPNTPPAQSETETESEVGNEITRLAQDIADVLTQNEDSTLQQIAPTNPAPDQTHAA